MAQGVVHHFDADHGFGLLKSDVDGELLRFSVEGLANHVSSQLEPGRPVRYDVSMGPEGKQAVRVSPI